MGVETPHWLQHRIADDGRHLCRSSSPTSSLQAKSIRGISSWVLSISKGGGSAASLVNLLQCSVTHQVFYCFLFNTEFTAFQFVALLSCHWALLRRVAPSLLTTLPALLPSFYTHTDPPKPSFLQADQDQLSQPLLMCLTLQAPHHVHVSQN